MCKTSNCQSADAKEFCSCPVVKCPRHPGNHDNGCDPCVRDNLQRGKMPACFFRAVREDVSGATDYSIEGFVEFFLKHRDEYRRKREE